MYNRITSTTLERLLNREIGVNVANDVFYSEKFSQHCIRGDGDTHDPITCSFKLDFLKNRSKIIEIISTPYLIFTVTLTGVCAVFSYPQLFRLCFLNIHPNEIIRSVFYNKLNSSIIIVSTNKDDDFLSLHVRYLLLDDILKCKLSNSIDIFTNEILRYPSYIEFDNVNNKIMIFHANFNLYKIFDLSTFQFLYSISDPNIEEVKISYTVLLCIYHRSSSFIKLAVIDINSGRLLHSFNYMLHKSKMIQFIELFDNKLIVKQENANLQLYDIIKHSVIEIDKSKVNNIKAFTYLYLKHIFLIINSNKILVYDLNGNEITRFQNHVLFHTNALASNIQVDSKQDYIISFCKHPINDLYATINISRLSSGDCIGCIGMHEDDKRRALDEVSSICYDEEHDEIITGTKYGYIFLLGNVL